MGAERTPNKSQHTKLTLEKKILTPLLPGFELAIFWSWVRRSYNKLSRPPVLLRLCRFRYVGLLPLLLLLLLLLQQIVIIASFLFPITETWLHPFHTGCFLLLFFISIPPSHYCIFVIFCNEWNQLPRFLWSEDFILKMTNLRKEYFIHSPFYELFTERRFYYYNRGLLEKSHFLQ